MQERYGILLKNTLNTLGDTEEGHSVSIIDAARVT